MLKGIDPVLSPDLLKVLCEMGHGDEIVLADAFFPGVTCAKRLIRADGVLIPSLLKGIAPLWSFDRYAAPVTMMAAVAGDKLDDAVEASYRAALNFNGTIDRIDRFKFYDRVAAAFAVVQTSDTAQYGNIILRKGNFT